MKTAISLPDELFQRAEKAAHHLGISRSEFYSRAIHRLVDTLEKRLVTEKLNEVYGDEGSALSPDLKAQQSRVLPDEGW